MGRLDKAYESYYGTNSMFETKTKQIEVPKNKFLNIIKKETEMTAQIIADQFENFNNFIEFSDAFYTDEDILLPTISESLANNGKNTTLISPHIQTKKSKRGLSTIRTGIENPFYIYGEIVTPKLITDLSDVDCFISSINRSKLINHFKTWASLGVPCIYTMSGQLDQRFKASSDNITQIFEKATKDNKLDYKVTFDYDSKTNCVSKIYTLKRK